MTATMTQTATATVERTALLAALKTASVAASTGRVLPILANVLLTVSDGRIALACTNLEIGVTTSVPASADGAWRAALDAALLLKTLSGSTGETVTLVHDDEKVKVTIRCGGTKTVINGLSPDDFPVIPTDQSALLSVELPGDLLKAAIARTEFAAAKDDSRPVLAAILTRFDGSHFTLAAADGFRLAVCETEAGETFGDRLDLLPPARAMRALAGLIGSGDAPVRLSVNDARSLLRAEVDGATVVLRLIEGTFPDFRQIIPRETATDATFDKAELLAAVKRAAVFAKDNNDVIRLDLKDDELIVSAAAAERGGTETTLSPISRSGPDARIAFSAKFLIDAIEAGRGKTTELRLNGGTQAGVVADPDDASATHVLMPMVTS